MNLCSDGHDEICYEGRQCPACYHITNLKATIDDKEAKISDIDDQLNTLLDEVIDLRAENNQLRGI